MTSDKKIDESRYLTMTAEQIKQEICEVGHRLYNHGFVAANDGNISVKLNDNEFTAHLQAFQKARSHPI